jgi:hypothetical protein
MDSRVGVEVPDDLKLEETTLRNIFSDTKRLPPGSGVIAGREVRIN